MEPRTPQSFIAQICTECGCPGIARPLTEGYNAIIESASSVLYHFVTAGNLCQMIRNNRFTPSDHESSLHGGKKFMSFSRTGNFEEGWPALFYSSSNSDDWCMVRLTIDGDRFNTHPNVKDSSGKQHPVKFAPIDWKHATGKGQGKEDMLASDDSSAHKFTGKALPDSQAHPWAQSEDRLLTDSDQIPGFLDYVKRIDIVLRKEGCEGWSDFASQRRALLRNLKKIGDSGKVHVYASLTDFNAGRECPIDTIGTLGETTMCESVHTARAVEVNTLYNRAFAYIREWIDESIENIRTGKQPSGIVQKEETFNLLQPDMVNAAWISIPGQVPVIVLLALRKPSYNERRVNKTYFNPLFRVIVLDLYGIATKCIDHNHHTPLIHQIRGSMEIIPKFDFLMIHGIKELCQTPEFDHDLRHELTHAIQCSHGEKFRHEEQLDALNIPRDSYDSEKHHELLPWEIDADVHGNIKELISSSPNYSATELAKIIYNRFIHNRMEYFGYSNQNRKKQCWETAVSLARAIKLASERQDVDEENLDSIIAHIDDYAV